MPGTALNEAFTRPEDLETNLGALLPGLGEREVLTRIGSPDFYWNQPLDECREHTLEYDIGSRTFCVRIRNKTLTECVSKAADWSFRERYLLHELNGRVK